MIHVSRDQRPSRAVWATSNSSTECCQRQVSQGRQAAVPQTVDEVVRQKSVLRTKRVVESSSSHAVLVRVIRITAVDLVPAMQGQ